MSSDEQETPLARASIVDVFENFFQDSIRNLSAKSAMGLAPRQVAELTEELDRFLASEAHSEFSEDAICVDCLANPILVLDDPSEPITTRKAKQVGLMHSEVVFPLPPLILEYEEIGLAHLVSLLSWTRKNEKLLRHHMFTLMLRPNFLHVMGEDAGHEILQSLTDTLMQPQFESIRRRFAMVETDREAVEASVAAVLTDAVSSGTVRGSIEFLDQDAALLYDAFAGGELLQSIAHSDTAPTENIVQRIDLPAIDAMSDEDFVAIRMSSEDFASFRTILSRALQRTKIAMDTGTDLDDAFKSSLDEVRFKTELLQNQINDKALLPFLKKTLQTASIGAFIGTSSALASNATQGALLPQALAARGSATFVLTALLALIFYKPPSREERLLRFYHVLLGEE